MSFGGYNYGPDEPEDGDGEQQEEEVRYQRGPNDPDHPASTEKCDHLPCKRETPETRQRICEGCDFIMDPSEDNTCSLCGDSVSH